MSVKRLFLDKIFKKNENVQNEIKPINLPKLSVLQNVRKSLPTDFEITLLRNKLTMLRVNLFGGRKTA